MIFDPAKLYWSRGVVNIKAAVLLSILLAAFSSIDAFAAPNSDIWETGNINPTIDLNITPARKPVDIVIMTDYTGTKLASLDTQINALKAQFSAVNVEPAFHVVSNIKQVGIQNDQLYEFKRYGRFYYKVSSYERIQDHGTEEYYSNYTIEKTVDWETTQGLISQYSNLPVRNPQNVSFTKSALQVYTATSLRQEWYDVTIQCTNDVKTSGAVEEEIHYHHTTSTQRLYGSILAEWAKIDTTWQVGKKISDVSYPVYSFDFDKLNEVPLRVGSDRHLMFVSDGILKDYGQALGNYFSFGDMTDTLNDYIKNNGFSLYGVVPNKTRQTTLYPDKVSSIDQYREYSLFRMENGELLRLGNRELALQLTSGFNMYPYAVTGPDTSKEKEVIESNNGNNHYYLMNDGTVEVFTPYTDKRVAVEGLSDIKQIAVTSFGDFYCVTNSGVVYFYDEADKEVTKMTGFNYGIDRILYTGADYIFLSGGGAAFGIRGYYNGSSWDNTYLYPIYIRYTTTAGSEANKGLAAIKDAKSFHVYYKGASVNGLVVQYTSGSIEQFLDYDSYRVDSSGGRHTDYPVFYQADGFQCIESNVVSLTATKYSVLINKTDGATRVISADMTSGTPKRMSASIEIPFNSLTKISFSCEYDNWYDQYYFKDSAGRTYRFNLSDQYPYPIVGSNVDDLGTGVKKVTMGEYNRTLYILYGNGSLTEYYRNWASTSVTVTNYTDVKNVYSIPYWYTYILYYDGTVSGKGDSDYGQLGVVGYSSGRNVFNSSLTFDTTKTLYSLLDIFNKVSAAKFYNAGAYADALNDIYKRYSSNSAGSLYVLLGDEIKYESAYDDYESDPEYARSWRISHDAYYFDNSMGVSVYHNPAGFSVNPPVKLDKVGKYIINLYARDNPKANDLFDNYRLWSLGNHNLTVYIHRRPIALLKTAIQNNGNGTYTVAALDAGSYDPDHNRSRADKGIVAREWRWRESTSTEWVNTQMNKSDCDPEKGYIIQLRVKDVEGVWSDYNTITIDRDNPPVALFNLDKTIIKDTELLKVKDQSFTQSFSAITNWHWLVRNLDSGGRPPYVYIQNAQFANSNAGTGTLAGYDTNIKTSYSENGAGHYRIYLRVKDSNGLWSDGGSDIKLPINLSGYYSMDFVVDKAPTPSFTVANGVIKTTDLLKITDTTTTSGISSVVKWHWIVKKLNTDGSIPLTDLQNEIFTTHNSGSGELTGFDANVKTGYSDAGTGVYRIYLRAMNGNGMWSDDGTDEAYNLSDFFHRDIVVDSPPLASFVMEKNPIEPGELLKLKDTSVKTGVAPIAKWHWIVKKLDADGSEPVSSLQDQQFADSNKGADSLAGYDGNVKTDYSKEGPGTYRIYLRVCNGSGMWSDGGSDSRADLVKCFHSDLLVKEAFKLANFRVVKVKDLHLSSFYYNPATGQYEDRAMGVNTLAVDPGNFNNMADGLTKGYIFEFEIDTVNFNGESDTIEIIPRFYTCDNSIRDTEERNLYWEDSRHRILKAGEGGHAEWAEVILRSENRTIKEGNNATWRGYYLIPGTAWAVPWGTTEGNAAENRLNRDIIVNFEIKGYKAGLMKFDYNLKQWPAERSVSKYPYEVGDVIRYSYKKSNLEDIGVILNRP